MSREYISSLDAMPAEGIPLLRWAANEPADIAILMRLNRDPRAQDVLRIGATTSWASREERSAWARDAIRGLLKLDSRRLASALEGSLIPQAGQHQLRGERWLRIEKRLMWPDASRRRPFRAFGYRVAMTPSQVRHTPGVLGRARQDLAEHVPAAWLPTAREAFDAYADALRGGGAAGHGRRSARGRKSYFTDVWWRDAALAYRWCSRGQLRFAAADTEGNELERVTRRPREYVVPRVTKWLKDAGLGPVLRTPD